MRKRLSRIIQILDGVPVTEGRRGAGQSVVELALITPILIVLLAGLVEIGWFANNYLTLLDVARSGARRGATLQEDLSVITWEETYRLASPLNISALRTDYQAANVGTMAYIPSPPFSFSIAAQQTQRNRFRQCADGGERAFYNEIVCLMIASLDPLTLDPTNGIDDIVVSGFGLQMVDPANNRAPGSTPPWLGANRPVAGDVPQIVVVSRFPSNANECDVQADSLGAPELTPLEPRDPFDFNQNSQIDYVSTAPAGTPNVGYRITNDDFSEVWGTTQDGTGTVWGFDPVVNDLAGAEKQVGFVWSGNHRITDTYCVGSEWRTQEIERLFNLNNFIDPGQPDQRELLPAQGLVLVEMFWRHQLLLNLPFFTVLENNAELSVWAAFPMQAARPSIVFES